MKTITVVFNNGDIVEFNATEFEPNLGDATSHFHKVNYKDARNEDSAIELRTNQIAGIFVTTNDPKRNQATHFIAPGQTQT